MTVGARSLSARRCGDRDGTRIGLLIALLLLSSRAVNADIVIDEIHYDPAEKTEPLEFVELHNTGSSAVDLSGWFFAEGIDFVFPPGAMAPPDGYVVVAENPAALSRAYGAVPSFGPFEGKLSNEGERIALRDSAGHLIDEVDYRMGFPWPTAGGGRDRSIELLDPSLDNALGGSWRLADAALDEAGQLLRAGSVWHYRAGTSEASAPRSAWRSRDFDDSSWGQGRAPIGYGEDIVATVLDDMQGGYSSVFLRIEFEVENPAAVGELALEARYDDGFNAWINGTHVVSANVPGNDLAFDATASSAIENLDFVGFPLTNPRSFLVPGRNVLAVELYNASISSSSDAFFDARLTRTARSGSGPTPGAPNVVATQDVPPILRRVAHEPRQPIEDGSVRVSVLATDDADGVAEVFLEYQIVEPGVYIELNDSEYAEGWTRVDLHDDGAAGDTAAGDGIFTVILPRSLQRHRRLIRYRITAVDGQGLSIRAPYADDPVPNFAYFVYDGLPGWSGAIQPGSTDPNRRRVVDYSPQVLGSIPVYHLVTKRSSTEDSTWNSRYGGSDYRWWGTLVYDGVVYDHVRFRARGGVWRYAMGKNMWKFNFWRGHRFHARDEHGRPYAAEWDKLNFSACIQQGDYLHRGEQGMFEAAAFDLFNLAGTEAPLTHWVHFRIIDETNENGPTQYDGDFWGLYLAIEQMDGAFLDEHRLPDGNLYKMEGGTGELNNQGATGATDKSDLNTFLNTYESSNPSESWWRENLSLDRYYGYRAIVEAVHHYDIGYGKNYFYYLNPETDLWSVHAWDVDLTWADNMFGNGDEPFRSRVLARPALAVEYENRLREIRDLLYNPEATGRLLDELAGVIDDPNGGPSIVDSDRARWDYHPVMSNGAIVNLSKAGQGRFYQRATSKTFEGMVDLMKSYVVSRGSWIDRNILADPQIPRQPTVTATGPADFPIDRLTFRTSDFSDPQGSSTFAALEWRLADMTGADAGAPFLRGQPKPQEIVSVWESGEIDSFEPEVTVPANLVGAGRSYRLRVRMKDTSGRCSAWSRPLAFVATGPRDELPQKEWLRITEIHYHPPESEDEEFIELQNIGAAPLDLTHVRITGGVEFRFDDGDLAELPPGGIALVAGDRNVFVHLHPELEDIVAGDYDGRLDNGGERIALVWGVSETIVDFEYEDWYALTDGVGHSLVVVDPAVPVGALSDPAAWRESEAAGGSPGFVDGEAPSGGFQRPGDANQDGFVDLSDGITLLLALFGGRDTLPCDGASIADGANLVLDDWNGDSNADLSDAIALMSWLFQGGPPHVLGTRCVRIEGCESACGF